MGMEAIVLGFSLVLAAALIAVACMGESNEGLPAQSEHGRRSS